MFNLIYRDGARENAGHYEVREKTSASDELKCGQIVHESDDNKLTRTTTNQDCREFLVCADSPSGDNTVVVMRIMPDMIFIVPIDEELAAEEITQSVSFVIKYDSDGTAKVSIAREQRGFIGLAREYGALKAGDRVEVRFNV